MINKHAKLAVLLLFATLGFCLTQSASFAAHSNAKPGVLVVTADRGFLGNSEIRAGFERFSEGRNAQLLFVVDNRSKNVLTQKLMQLKEQGSEQVIVLPLFISSADARWQMAKTWLNEASQNNVKITIAQPYGKSYLAVEDLADRLRKVHTAKQRLLLIGYGAANSKAAQQMSTELKQMAQFASTLSGKDIQAAVAPTRQAADKKALQTQFNTTLKGAHDTLIVPLLLAFKADSMMTFTNGLRRSIPKDAQLVNSAFSTAEALQQWMTYTTNKVLLQSTKAASDKIGVIALAHGSNWFWNQDIRKSLAPAAQKYPVVFTFSMADQPTIAQAVRKMEQKQVHGIVLVRVYGQASSFLPTIHRMLGVDVQHGAAHLKHDHSGMMMGGHMGHSANHGLAAAPRIRTSLPIVTVGGVEDSPWFAKALLTNARSVSTDASRETIILTAHGAGADKDNQHWLGILDSLANQMKNEKDYDFKDIQYVTWREDWPDENKKEVARARKMVKKINSAGGRTLIVPARINSRGAANVYLKRLNFGWSQGFAQTPYLNQWFEEQVKLGMKELGGSQSHMMHVHGH